ncbi:membrane protein [Gordonia phage Phendrix]|uniref:Membrane protein n=1 Tax=Gordonia phage Phendrix TaxID=2593335 RepID=A0A514U130_9CAUD|nr:membrane protein [Gordonia phage Phendrix]QDK02643.1 membrane protein [Gordonia phage Phendrix]
MDIDQARRKVEAAEEFIHGSTLVLSLFQIVYGLILIFKGAGLWTADIYRVAASVPGAPTSWGVVSILLGIMLYITQRKKYYRLIKWTCRGSAVWAMWLAIAFTISGFTTEDQEYDWTSATPLAVYSTFALLFILRERLARAWETS